MAQEKVDSVLREMLHLEQESIDELDSVLELTSRVVPRPARRPARARNVAVLVRFQGDSQALAKAGLQIRTVAGNIASGELALDALNKLSAVDGVLEVEAARPLWRELDVSVPDVRADVVHAGPPSNRGDGVMIGIIDSGINFTHGSFLTAGGQTRIRYIWDQSLTPGAGEFSPSGFSYGVEYTAANINAALAAADPSTVVRHVDVDPLAGHGTHVSGIAAGDGSPAGNGGAAAFTFVGVAPEADLIVVRNSVTTEALGDSASTLDAIQYIFNKAATLQRPVVINLSQGDNIGPHDGTSLLELGIDNLLGAVGRVLVKSSGNEGNKSRHASGTVLAGGSANLTFAVDPNDDTREIIDIWYSDVDRFRFQITPPGGGASASVDPGTTTTLNLPNGNAVFVDSVVGAPGNGDNRIFLTLRRGTQASIQQGNWTITLTGLTVQDGGFHAWIERGALASTAQFVGAHVDGNFTISIPGTSQEVITVGSYINTGFGAGNLSTFSSRGPTRDNRRTPTLCAPGENVTSARATGILLGAGNYHSISGTSMAAPHVTGAAALMLNVNSSMTQTGVRDCLENTAREDLQTGPAPDNNDWGRGKLDVEAAVACAQPLKLKVADDVVTLKRFDDQGTSKRLDDPITHKQLDDPATHKKLDDPTTRKQTDDPVTIKRLDDPTTRKQTDDPVTSKQLDDGGGFGGTANKRVDDVKTERYDKNPSTDRVQPVDPRRIRRVTTPRGISGTPRRWLGAGGAGGRGRPFVLATPHHAEGWAGTYPGALEEALTECEMTLAELGDELAQLSEAVAQGQADPETLAALEQVSA